MPRHPLTGPLRRTLLALRAVGPCSNRRLGEVLGVSASDAFPLLSALRRCGWAEGCGPELYDVTAAGVHMLAESLPDDEAAALAESETLFAGAK